MAVCVICERRKAKRTCPAKGAKICPQCCGEHRERTLDCPFACPYLQQAHDTEPVGFPPEETPYRDVRLTDPFLREHSGLIAACARGAALAAADAATTLDADARQAFDALVETYKTLEGGILYESKPQAPQARAIAESVRESAEAFRREETERTGMTRISDGDVLKAVVFLRRLVEAQDNGRPRSRRFLHFLARQFPAEPAEPESSIILPGR